MNFKWGHSIRTFALQVSYILNLICVLIGTKRTRLFVLTCVSRCQKGCLKFSRLRRRDVMSGCRYPRWLSISIVDDLSMWIGAPVGTIVVLICCVASRDVRCFASVNSKGKCTRSWTLVCFVFVSSEVRDTYVVSLSAYSSFVPLVT